MRKTVLIFLTMAMIFCASGCNVMLIGFIILLDIIYAIRTF